MRSLKKMANAERRRADRIKDEELSLKIRMSDFDVSTHTINISSSGLYCKVSKDVPIMSRVKLILMIPDPVKSDKETKGVEVEGVVVRGHPVIIDGEIKHYDVAIFFDSLEPRAEELIAGYIARKKAA